MSLCQSPPVGLRSRWSLFCSLALVATVLAASAKTRASEPSLAQLGVQQWRQAEGLSSNWVRDLVETPDGFIWIASVRGVSRFDGKEFTHFNPTNLPGLPRSPVTALALATDGALLIGLEYGGIRRLKGNTLDPALPSVLNNLDVAVQSMRWFDNALWIATKRGLWIFRDGSTMLVATEPLSDADVVALQVVESSLWARTRSGGLWQLVDGRWRASLDAPNCGHHWTHPTAKPVGSSWITMVRNTRPVRMACGHAATNRPHGRRSALLAVSASCSSTHSTACCMAGPTDWCAGRTAPLNSDRLGPAWMTGAFEPSSRINAGICGSARFLAGCRGLVSARSWCRRGALPGDVRGPGYQ